MRGFQYISQNATPTTESAPCRHLTQPCQCDSQKTRNTTRLKCCACHEKWRWTRPKCCACHENCNASSENIAKVLRLPHKTTFDTSQNTSECHGVPRLPRETKQRHLWNLQNDPFCRTYHRHGYANGCGRLRTSTQRRAKTPSAPRPPEWNGNPCYAFGKKWMCTWTADTWLAMRQLSDRCTVVIPDSCQKFTIFVWSYTYITVIITVFMRQSYRSYALVMPKLYLHIRYTYAKIILIPQFHDILPYFFTMVMSYLC